MDVTDVIGPMGKTQIKALIALLVRPLPPAFVFLAMQLSLIELDHWCPPTSGHQNLTAEEWKECYVPQDSAGKFSRCQFYDGDVLSNETRNVKTCSSWEYDRSLGYQSLRAEWNLVCDRGWYVSIMYLAFTLGNLLAYVPTGYLADKYGRKPICVVGLLLSGAAALGSAFCTNVEQMVATRFLSGLLYAAVQNPFICLYLECVGQEYRNWVILSFGGTWGLCVIIISGISYYISNWRLIFILSSFPVHLPLLFVVWKLLPESARWLLSVKKYEQAEKLIVQQTKENGIILVDKKHVMEQLKKKVEVDKDKQGRVTFFDLLKDRHTLRTTVVLYLTFVLTVFVNHGYYLSIGRLGGSLHVNLMLNAVVDILGTPVFFILIRYVSKRRALLSTVLLTGIFFLATIPISDELRWLRITLAMMARFCNSIAYNLLYVFSSEIFPTALRVLGVSGAMTSGRIGSLLASFTDDMGRVYGRNALIGMFGSFSIVTSVILILLPKLTNRNLPDSLAETRMMTSGKLETNQVELQPALATQKTEIP